jgi:hypothetical protein
MKTTTVSWNLFVSAAILSVGLMLKLGAPIEALAGGVGLAAFLNWKGLVPGVRRKAVVGE